MFLPLVLWHPHILILKIYCIYYYLLLHFKLKNLSLKANNIMKNNCELCPTLSPSGMRVSYSERFLFMNIHGNKYWGQIGFGFNVTFYWMHLREFFWGSVFFIIETFKMKKKSSIISTNGFTLNMICILVCHSVHYWMSLTQIMDAFTIKTS